MKQSRDIHKTIRIPERTFKLINKFEGSTWNDKVNNLLDFYMFQEKEYRTHIENLDQEIKEKQKLLEEFQKSINKFQDLFK